VTGRKGSAGIRGPASWYWVNGIGLVHVCRPSAYLKELNVTAIRALACARRLCINY
jgi:hypothetical protein